MNIYAVIAFILCCLVKALLPQTAGWESFLLFATAATVYYAFIASLPKDSEIKSLEDNYAKLLTEVDGKFSGFGLELKKAQDDAKEAKKLVSEAHLASGFVRRERRVNP